MENSILKLLSKLVSFRSVSNNKKESVKLIDFVENYLSTANNKLAIKKFVNNDFPSLLVHGKNHPLNKPFRLLLNAHLDVVPATDNLFKMKLKNKKAYGRGVYDMKGAGSIMIKLFKNLSLNEKLPDDIGLTLVTDEEIGGFNGSKFFLEKDAAKTRFFLGGEPTNFKILNAHKGIMKIIISYSGKSAHGSRPWEGENAIVKISQAISNFYSHNPLPKKAVWDTTYSVNCISGGVAFNVIADKAEAVFDIRRVEKDKPVDIFKKMKKYFPGAHIKVAMNEPGLNTDKNIQEIIQLTKIIEKHTRKKPFLIHEHLATDARFYYQNKIPAIHFGPIGGGIHQNNEWVDISSLNDYYKILKDFLLNRS